jgi:hypothetical protein
VGGQNRKMSEFNGDEFLSNRKVEKPFKNQLFSALGGLGAD